MKCKENIQNTLKIYTDVKCFVLPIYKTGYPRWLLHKYTKVYRAPLCLLFYIQVLHKMIHCSWDANSIIHLFLSNSEQQEKPFPKFSKKWLCQGFEILRVALSFQNNKITTLKQISDTRPSPSPPPHHQLFGVIWGDLACGPQLPKK